MPAMIYLSSNLVLLYVFSGYQSRLWEIGNLTLIFSSATDLNYTRWQFEFSRIDFTGLSVRHELHYNPSYFPLCQKSAYMLDKKCE